ncbi:MAG: sugar nucleotide-binding protein [Patescibacteria group bacterium]|nr:sugar nucleotide-binding protein [Patescibacteria group bacterium]
MKILIVGNGFVGNRCAHEWKDSQLSSKHIDKVEDALEILDEYKPDAVLNAAGVRGKPNVDWCETHQMETILGNTQLPIILAQACQTRGTYLLHIGSGCVFYGPSPDPKGWKEDDFGNPVAVYSRCKLAADLTLSTLPHVGIARIRMPMDYLPSPYNIIDKLATYEKIIDVENSLTVVEDMVEVFYQLLQKKACGIFHVTNPGTIKHKEIVALYEKLVGPTRVREWVSEEDLVRMGLAKKVRSTNILQSANLEKIGIWMRPAKEAARATMERYAQEKKKLN